MSFFLCGRHQDRARTPSPNPGTPGLRFYVLVMGQSFDAKNRKNPNKQCSSPSGRTTAA